MKWALEAGALHGHLSRSDFLPGDGEDCAAILPNGHMRKGSLNPPLSVSDGSRRRCAHPSQEFAYSKVYPYWWTWSTNTLRLTSPARRTTGRIPARWKMVKSDLIELRLSAFCLNRLNASRNTGSKRVIKLLFTSVKFVRSKKLTWVWFSRRQSASWGRFSLHRPHFATAATPVALLCASASSCSAWAPQSLGETSQHCCVRSWERTPSPAPSYAPSSRVCGHCAKHFLWFSKINAWPHSGIQPQLLLLEFGDYRLHQSIKEVKLQTDRQTDLDF